MRKQFMLLIDIKNFYLRDGAGKSRLQTILA
nr:MAG TPA: hypothetical protein [Caudoviricetes sp.]